MKLTGIRDLTDKTRESGMQTLTQYAEGTSPEELFSEGAGTLDFSSLEKEIESKDSAAEEAPDDFAKRMEATFAAVIHRDALYSHSGRRFMFALGVHNGFRALYEGGKIYIEGQGV